MSRSLFQIDLRSGISTRLGHKKYSNETYRYKVETAYLMIFFYYNSMVQKDKHRYSNISHT